MAAMFGGISKKFKSNSRRQRSIQQLSAQAFFQKCNALQISVGGRFGQL